jgi:hypothetical protein
MCGDNVRVAYMHGPLHGSSGLVGLIQKCEVIIRGRIRFTSHLHERLTIPLCARHQLAWFGNYYLHVCVTKSTSLVFDSKINGRIQSLTSVMVNNE